MGAMQTSEVKNLPNFFLLCWRHGLGLRARGVTAAAGAGAVPAGATAGVLRYGPSGAVRTRRRSLHLLFCPMGLFPGRSGRVRPSLPCSRPSPGAHRTGRLGRVWDRPAWVARPSAGRARGPAPPPGGRARPPEGALATRGLPASPVASQQTRTDGPLHRGSPAANGTVQVPAKSPQSPRNPQHTGVSCQSVTSRKQGAWLR